jgi:L-aspartate semialdehyde sulfurtransferase ferredoxin
MYHYPNPSRLDNRGSARLADILMARETQRFWLTFDGDSSRKPLIYEMSKKFEVIFNIRNASVTPNIGIIALELEGERNVIKEAVAWLEANDVQVEPVEINTIEG